MTQADKESITRPGAIAASLRVARAIPVLLAASLGCLCVGCTGGPADVAEVPQTQQLQDIVAKADRPVVVDFYLPHCPWCAIQASAIQNLSTQYSAQAAFYRVDSVARADVAGSYSVRRYPTVLVFAGGQERSRIVGAQMESAYRRAIDQALSQTPPKAK